MSIASLQQIITSASELIAKPLCNGARVYFVWVFYSTFLSNHFVRNIDPVYTDFQAGLYFCVNPARPKCGTKSGPVFGPALAVVLGRPFFGKTAGWSNCGTKCGPAILMTHPRSSLKSHTICLHFVQSIQSQTKVDSPSWQRIQNNMKYMYSSLKMHTLVCALRAVRKTEVKSLYLETTSAPNCNPPRGVISIKIRQRAAIHRISTFRPVQICWCKRAKLGYRVPNIGRPSWCKRGHKRKREW